MDKPLKSFFKKFLERETLFVNKEVLEVSFTPKNILHRDKQIEELAEILAPALKFNKPSNIFIYGKTGTGKTVTVNRVVYDLVEVAREENVPLNYVYVNCKLGRADTEYRLIAYICRELGIDLPSTGLPTDEVYNIFYKAVDKNKQLLILILDEIDQLIFKMGDDVLYTLTRINSYLTNSKISLIGISNFVKLLEQVDPRVKSSLGEESVVFPPYDANQIKDILEDRAKRAFRSDALEQGVLEKCAAIAARDHGDARRAIDLLRVAGELADREGSKKITLNHLDAAQEKLEKDRVLDIVASQPKQHQCVLFSLILLDNTKKKDESITTGAVYEKYVQLCKNLDIRPLTQRRVSDIISEFDSLGLIQSVVKSRGRLGRTRDISIAFDISVRPRVVSLLKQSLGY
ncbi:MAG: archaeal cell division control protein 6 [Candidatus Woesearchaeota archaeon]|nr:archaeal cell division control protein 6 [Candidatus Woesearchaeota archaeon]MDN5328136.1 archaeal cell division control protein 6 [Candidatus Woesearchaeota archaeon]